MSELDLEISTPKYDKWGTQWGFFETYLILCRGKFTYLGQDFTQVAGHKSQIKT